MRDRLLLVGREKVLDSFRVGQYVLRVRLALMMSKLILISACGSMLRVRLIALDHRNHAERLDELFVTVTTPKFTPFFIGRNWRRVCA